MSLSNPSPSFNVISPELSLRLAAGRSETAIAVLNRAIAIEPGSETARRLLMQAYGALNRSLSLATGDYSAPSLPPVLLVSQPVATSEHPSTLV